MIAQSLKVGLATVILALSGSAFAQGPQAWLDVDGERHTIPVTEATDGKTWGLGNYNPDSGEYEWSMETDEFMVMLNGIMDPDPSISYGISVTDFGTPSIFGFVFATPIVPVGFPNSVESVVVGGLIDATGDGITMTPTDGSGLLQIAEVLPPATNMGVDVGPMFSAGASSPGAGYGYGPYSSGPLAGPGPGPWTMLRTTTGFSLSGGGDIFSVAGSASIVPEPSSIALAMLAGLGLFGFFRRRR